MIKRILTGMALVVLCTSSAHAITFNLFGQGQNVFGDVLDISLSLDIDETIAGTGPLTSLRNFPNAVQSGTITVDDQTESFVPNNLNAVTTQRRSASTLFINLSGVDSLGQGFDHTLLFIAAGLFSPQNVNDLGALLPEVAASVNNGNVIFGGTSVDPTFSSELRSVSFTSASTSSSVSAVPLPAAAPLLASGLLALGLMRRFRRRKV